MFPRLREFLDDIVSQLKAGTLNQAQVTDALDTFALGIGMDEGERAMAAKLEEIGAEDVNAERNDGSLAYAKGHSDGYLAGLTEGMAQGEKIGRRNQNAAANRKSRMARAKAKRRA
jgi:hypothetical protein